MGFLKLFACFGFVLFQACEEPYNPEFEDQDVKPLLVVDGFINADGNSEIAVSQSLTMSHFPVVQPLSLTPLQVSSISIVGEDGTVYPGVINRLDNSSYIFEHPPLNTGVAYFLRIQTNGQVYESAPTKALISGAIDRLDYQVVDDHLEIFVSSKDTRHATRYYRWDFTEAWQFRSAFKADAVMKDGVLVDITPATDYEICFRFSKSNDLLIGSTQGFSDNQIYWHPIQFIANDSEKLQRRYSILVKQYAISSASFLFWELVKKNSEQIGDIFGTMPTEVSGNIKNLSDPTEKVIGFVEVLKSSEMRFFINAHDRPSHWRPNLPFLSGCAIRDTVELGAAADFFAQRPTYLPVEYVYMDPGRPFPTHIESAPDRCVDCRFHGQLQRPDFWID